MLDFKEELNQLLGQETQPLPRDELAEMVSAGQRILASLGKKQTEISLQVEEIYDIVGHMDTAVLQEAMRSEKRRADMLVDAIMGLCDILEDFCAYAKGSEDAELDRQARVIWRNSTALLDHCG
ncbi:MAG: hypothetical protein LBF64_04930, partial [Oscillospiraceae bacterium]|nr:hypothetical protein [Oscillospiraceae bacterium]